MKKGIAFLLLIALAVSALVCAGCTRRVMWAGSESPCRTWATYKYFTGTDKKAIKVQDGDTLTIDFDSEVGKGSLTLTIEDPEGKSVFSMESGEEGSGKIEISESGKYTLVIDGEETSGSFDINWYIE